MVERRGRSVVLIIGISGAGKSTALAEFSCRGHYTVDTDDPGWIIQVETPQDIEPMWDVDPICKLLDGHRAGWLFVSGVPRPIVRSSEPRSPTVRRCIRSEDGSSRVLRRDRRLV